MQRNKLVMEIMTVVLPYEVWGVGHENLVGACVTEHGPENAFRHRGVAGAVAAYTTRIKGRSVETTSPIRQALSTPPSFNSLRSSSAWVLGTDSRSPPEV